MVEGKKVAEVDGMIFGMLAWKALEYLKKHTEETVETGSLVGGMEIRVSERCGE